MFNLLDWLLIAIVPVLAAVTIAEVVVDDTD